ncbi:MAG: dihydroxyacetone kinase subunit L [Methylococcaceae bacterium]|nr:dihydroxyacetone kinase subunit L [Methylococcaceae bacterium]
MSISTATISKLIASVVETIEKNATELTELDQAIGDGDHVSNLQRGLQALTAQSETLSQLDWSAAFQKMGMTLMSSVGGASGSLYGTFFIALSKNVQNLPMTRIIFGEAFLKAVEAVKQRGKADKGEKTMLDVLIPVADCLNKDTNTPDLFERIKKTAEESAESTKEMIATKGRAAFLGERSIGHIDAGAKSSQLIICAIIEALTAPS